MSPTVIAEAGVNHNGSLDLGLALVDAAADAGAQVVKFQTFVADRLVGRTTPKALYQQAQTEASESQHAMLRRLELDRSAHVRLIRHCADRGIEFLSTPFDEQSVDLLVDVGIRRLKIPSGEITNGPLLLKAARTGLPVILSTGMSDLSDIEQALGVLTYGYLAPARATPTRAAFAAAYQTRQGQALLAERVTLLHCTSEYPAPVDSINLLAMDTLRARFGLAVGLSDHSEGIVVALAAAARGATIIEKHVTLDRTLPGPDHRASIEPAELRALVEGVATVARALGRPEKAVQTCERANRDLGRKSLVAAVDIPAGTPLSPDHLIALRPGEGLSPMDLWDLVGRPADRHYRAGEAIGSQGVDAAA